jgi:FkbM family methyltransferase
MKTSTIGEAVAPAGNFEAHLLQELKAHRFNDHQDNYDTFFRGQPPKKPKRTIAALKQALLSRFLPAVYFRKTLDEFKQFSFFYNLLEDQASRDLLVSLIAYRILGFRKVKLARNNPAYWEGIELAKTLDTGRPAIHLPFLTWPLPCFDVRPLGFDMRVHTYAQAIAINFVQKQYVLPREGVVCKAEPGDIVIDAGGCWGDTSLQFACEVGAKGHVFVFEFVPSNLDVMRQNIALNPHLAPLITVVKNPVGLETGNKMFFFENGPASRVANTKVDDRYIECTILSIDQMVADNNVEKVDFIKMDVEGSELDALKGAEQTIRKFKPKLAICIYHKPDDYLTIPKYLSELNLGYRFYIEHHMIFLNETVLFAIPESRV